MEIGIKDEQLIDLLRENGRLSVSDIARRLAVSRTAAQMRLQKLERNGVIEGYSVKLSPEYLENRVRALVMMKFPPSKRADIEILLENIPQVTSLYSISGIYDLAAVVSAPSMGVLDVTIDRIGCLEGIGETMSSIILSTKIDR
ncbi:MAG: Lrp/AsnC family transcriptional regulator [Rhodobacterales bacterium]|nr:Lrp/AsnC family transcriptional regulator [Rhodobacterales bacterium]